MFKTEKSRAEAATRIKSWTRARFSLASDATIFVSELQSGTPGFPPLHTVVAFWIDGRHYHFSVFRPLAEVGEADIPPAWYREALRVEAGAPCDCC